VAEGRGKRLPAEALVALRQRLDALPARHPERKALLENAASLYGLSRATLYRAVQQQWRPRSARRADHGRPRKLGAVELERVCEVIAALKLRTMNKKGRHLSTNRAIEQLEGEGVDTPDGRLRLAPGTLTRTTANRYLRRWGYDHARLTREPAAVRFQAEHSNALWQFDMSPSDLKQVPAPLWSEPGRGAPTLMLYSVVDDRSGVAYQEYRCVYGEDAESALRFLYNAMAPKPEDSGLVLQGIPEALYLDNGPVAKSTVFKAVMASLGVRVMPHLPAGKDGRRTTARSKGKVERPFRTVKEAHETLYHFHQPQDEAEANLWLHRYLARYNAQRHRSEPHSRSEDWLANLPPAGLRAMCAWERYCAFAREPERRLVGGDARVTVGGVIYDVAAELAGETVTLWWGLFDQDLYVEHGDARYGPYRPSGGPIPLHRYRKPAGSKADERADRVAALADRLGLPRAALDGSGTALKLPPPKAGAAPQAQPFHDPDPFRQLAYPSVLAAKHAIADEIGQPLAALPEDDRRFIDDLVRATLDKPEVLARVRTRFNGKGRS
jgi:hypothetical protein